MVGIVIVPSKWHKLPQLHWLQQSRGSLYCSGALCWFYSSLAHSALLIWSYFLHSICLQSLNNFLSIWFLAKKPWVLCILLCSLFLSPGLSSYFFFLFIYLSSQQAFSCWLICLQQISYHSLQHLPHLVLIFCCNCLRKPFKIHLAEGWEIFFHLVGKSWGFSYFVRGFFVAFFKSFLDFLSSFATS